MSKKYTIARIERRGQTFEILVDPDKALKYRLGEKIPISRIVVYDEVYKDAKKGIRASEEEIRKAFGTTDILKIAQTILDDGVVQVTAEQRRRLIEDKKRQIIEFISKNTIDPRTNMPHPPQRIELAMEEVGVAIDPFKDAKEQALAIIEKLRRVIPIKMGILRFKLRLPGDVVGKAYGIVRSMSKITKEEWRRDGSWVSVIEIPTGLHVDLIERLNRISSGRIEVTPLEE